jgi:hypothetical protein
MNLSNLHSRIKENFGARASGEIGGTSVDTVVLDAINKGLRQVFTKIPVNEREVFATITLNSNNWIYALPTTDIDGNTISVKHIISAKLLDSSSVEYEIKEIARSAFFRLPRPVSTETLRPKYYTQGVDKFMFSSYPDQAYTLHLYVMQDPPVITTANLSTSLALSELWASPIEFWATSYCFMKLQHSEMRAHWFSLYREEVGDARADTNRKPNLVRRANPGFSVPVHADDPFTHSNRIN